VIISLIVAQSLNGVIGAQGALPWRLPRDLKRFRAITMGKPLIMGRATRESIGRPLDGRANIVLSRDPLFDRVAGGVVARSVSEALQLARAELKQNENGEVIVIGGESVFREFAPLSSRVYLTTVKSNVDGDRYFPAAVLHGPGWRLAQREEWPADSRNEFGIAFETWDRESPTAEGA
jgi:dihydrofolate reductase